MRCLERYLVQKKIEMVTVFFLAEHSQKISSQKLYRADFRIFKVGLTCVCVCVCVCVRALSHVQLFVTSCTVACQTLLSMEFSRQEYWSGLPFPPPGDLPDPRIEHASLALEGRFVIPCATWKAGLT